MTRLHGRVFTFGQSSKIDQVLKSSYEIVGCSRSSRGGPGDPGDGPLERDRIGPFEALVSTYDDLECEVIVSGIGAVASAVATSTALALRDPYDLVISAGIAGGYRTHGVVLTELIVADEIIYVDYVHPPDVEVLGVEPTAWTPTVFLLQNPSFR